MELYSTLTLLKVILVLASYPSFSDRLGQYRIRLLKPNKNINGNSLYVKNKNLQKKYSQSHASYELCIFYKNDV